ncbi:MAG: hypothetical protein AUH14_10340 [Candidatus Rokubacteria bacterium 13_2_20CM_69_15_1]|nr:MAG: hypothetical protein AUH14_10340 [Candidatus Rokubacteria bacterium 13_2_20CM_69_15_1]
MRLHVIQRAQVVGVSAACREVGISRTVFYRWRRRLERYGVDGVHPRRLQARPGPVPQLPPHVERRLLAVAIAEATWGCARLAAYAQRLWRLRVAPSTVQRLLRRHGLATRRQRLLVLEHHSAARAGLLTERTRQALWRLRHGQTRHVVAERPGELVCLDTFYIGKLKGVGKVWQITACDAASSYGVARILPALAHTAVTHFLRQVLLPAVRRAGWSLQRVLTDGGGEFKASFDEACTALGIRHTRIKPRHAWTNGFVERLQQTILTEHWRVVFRRHYFTSRTALDRSLHGFLQFYNFDRPHQGYRLRGRTPATVFHGAVAAARSSHAQLWDGERVNTNPRLDSLVLEYLDTVAALPRMRSMVRLGGTLITVLQSASAVTPEITPSPFKSLSALSSIMRLVPPDRLGALAEEHGFRQIDVRAVQAEGGKHFVMQSFRAVPPNNRLERTRDE